MKRKRKIDYLYPHLRYNRKAAQALNDSAYEWWLICDEGMEYPYPQRWHNWLMKYGTIRDKRLGKAIISFISSEDMEKYIKPWILVGKSGHKILAKEVPTFCKIVKQIMKIAKLKYENYKLDYELKHMK